jgi:hypothetical protein
VSGLRVRRILRMNSDYCPIGNYVIGLSSGDVVCILWDKD